MLSSGWSLLGDVVQATFPTKLTGHAGTVGKGATYEKGTQLSCASAFRLSTVLEGVCVQKTHLFVSASPAGSRDPGIQQVLNK